MKINVEELQVGEPLIVDIAGREDWLKEIYRSFPTPEGREEAYLTGRFELQRLGEGFVQVAGHFEYSPYVACNRCNQLFSWPLRESVNLLFSAQEPEYPADKDISIAELDAYYLEDGSTLDLELVLNEAVLLAIPARTVHAEVGLLECEVPAIEAETAPVYATTGEESKPNPFAVLNKLKLKN